MSAERRQAMIEAFAAYEATAPELSPSHAVVGTAPGTRLMRIERLTYGWRLWLATRDFVYGTFLECRNDGRILRFTTRVDEGDEVHSVRPSDEEIRSKLSDA